MASGVSLCLVQGGRRLGGALPGSSPGNGPESPVEPLSCLGGTYDHPPGVQGLCGHLSGVGLDDYLPYGYTYELKRFSDQDKLG